MTIEGYDKETDKEEFTLLPLNDEYVIGRYQERINMLEYGQQIAVRKSVYERLIRVAKDLKKINSNYKVIVVYGFRDIKKQAESLIKKRIKKFYLKSYITLLNRLC